MKILRESAVGENLKFFPQELTSLSQSDGRISVHDIGPKPPKKKPNYHDDSTSGLSGVVGVSAGLPPIFL